MKLVAVCLCFIVVGLPIWICTVQYDVQSYSSFNTLFPLRDQLLQPPPVDRCEHIENMPSFKPFVYLTQTEKCLPEYLKSLDSIGNATACQCDVLVLSFKDNCGDTSLPHVRYIFNSSTTWTLGRNLLYRTIMEREQEYLYYVFLDDDVVLELVEEGNSNPWRLFERSLLETQPAIGAADWNSSIIISAKQKALGCTLNNLNYASVPWFDALFNAFHYGTIRHLLPYEERFERESWWNSQIYLILKTEVLYHGQIMLDLNVLALNPVHRPYPRMESWDSVVEAATRVVKPTVPNKYQDAVDQVLYKWKVGSEEEINQFVYEHCLKPVSHCPPTAPFQWELP